MTLNFLTKNSTCVNYIKFFHSYSDIPAVKTPDGYTLMPYHKCDKDYYKSFDTVKEAKASCFSDKKCKGVYNVNCTYTTFYLCTMGVSLEKSSDSCIYEKGKYFLFIICSRIWKWDRNSKTIYTYTYHFLRFGDDWGWRVRGNTRWHALQLWCGWELHHMFRRRILQKGWPKCSIWSLYRKAR